MVDFAKLGSPADKFWAKHKQTNFPPFLSTEAKRELIETGAAFTVLAVRTMNGQNGNTQWVIDVDAPGSTQVQSISFDSTDSRDEFFRDLREYLRSNPSLRCRLTVTETKSGREFFKLEPEFHESVQNVLDDDEPMF